MRRVLKDVVLGLAGLAGLACILWFIAGLVFGASIVIFRTGSMEPTIPTGSAAVVTAVAASDIAVGDVLTVDRADSALPVTHRVVSIAHDPAVDGGRIIVLRGDANPVNDPDPYHLTEAKRVVFSVPAVGTMLRVSTTPLFLGSTTLIVAALMVWAFWPPRDRGAHAAHSDPIRGEA